MYSAPHNITAYQILFFSMQSCIHGNINLGQVGSPAQLFQKILSKFLLLAD